jgi:hypothetical protein
MNPNPRYSCIALAAVFRVPSGENQIFVRTNALNSKQSISTVTPWIMYSNTSGYDFLGEIETKLKAAYDTLWGGTAGNFSCVLNEACHILITNNSPNSITLLFDSGTFTAKRFLGTDSTSMVTVAGSGGTWESDYQPPYLWCPHMFTSRSTRDRYLTKRSQSNTWTKRPRIVRWSTEKVWRKYAWQTIASPYIVKGMSSYADFADSAKCSLDDPNCSFDKFMEYLDGSDSTGTVFPYQKQVCIIDDYRTMNQSIDPTLSTDRWYVQIPDAYMDNVSEDALFEETALESYSMELIVRRVG